jgi:hypothetical protein
MWTTVMGSNGRPPEVRNSETSFKVLSRARMAELDPVALAEALFSTYNLLEEYAPSWYTQAHHDKMESALRLTKKR